MLTYPGPVIRTALRPPWLALLAVLVVVVVAFYQLGMWQLGVSSSKAAREQAQAQAARPLEPLGEVLAPHQTFPEDGAGRPVLAEGEYAADLQFLVPGRRLEGQDGYWVVTPLHTSASGSPALLPVVRGFVTDPADADRPPATRLTVQGTLAPGEPAAPGELPEGQRGSIDPADLVNVWDDPVYNAFVFRSGEEPTLTAAAVRPVPTPVFGETGLVWRNVGYGIQWFVFAGFACYMYYRFLKEAASRPPGGPA